MLGEPFDAQDIAIQIVDEEDGWELAWHAFLGYQVCRFFAVEGAYTSLGSFSFEAQVVEDPGLFIAELSPRAWSISGLVGSPPWKGLSAFGKVGAAFWNAELDVDDQLGAGRAAGPAVEVERTMRDESRRRRHRSSVGLLLALASWPATAPALPVTLPTDAGGQVFDSMQFADGVVGSRLGRQSFTFQGPFPAEFNGRSVAEAILGPDLTNGLGISKDDAITLGFSRPGSVLAIWEAGDLREFGRTLLEASSDGGATFAPVAVVFDPAPATPDPEPSGYQTNFQRLDATRFGLPAGALIDALRITVLDGDAAFVHTDILAVASVPEPSSLWLLALGLVGLRLARRFA